MRYSLNIETKDEMNTTFHTLVIEGKHRGEAFEHIDKILDCLGGDFSSITIIAQPSLKECPRKEDTCKERNK